VIQIIAKLGIFIKIISQRVSLLDLSLLMKALIFAILLIFPFTAQAVEKAEIDTIFRAKCMDCHSQKTIYPWYSSLPLVKNLIQHDIEEGMSYFQIERDFIDNDQVAKQVLIRLKHEIKNDKMPPVIYRFAHLDKILSANEKEKILEFLDYKLENK
jgi:hypothetical protein